MKKKASQCKQQRAQSSFWAPHSLISHVATRLTSYITSIHCCEHLSVKATCLCFVCKIFIELRCSKTFSKENKLKKLVQMMAVASGVFKSEVWQYFGFLRLENKNSEKIFFLGNHELHRIVSSVNHYIPKTEISSYMPSQHKPQHVEIMLFFSWTIENSILFRESVQLNCS